MKREDLRWILGTLLRDLGFTETIRKLYLGQSRKFLLELPSQLLEAAWTRRSVVNDDFYPLVSDIDLTILINDDQLGSIHLGKKLKRPLLMQDIQFVSRRFLDAWLETGGFRNYQIPQWKQIYGIPFDLKAPHSATEERAFEVAYEVHLIYKQIAQKLIEQGGSQKKALNKLSLEMHRLKLFWETKNDDWSIKKRSDIPSPGDLPELMKMTDELCRSLILQLEPPLNVYDWRRTVIREDEYGYDTAVSFKSLPIYVLKDPGNILEARKLKKNRFFVTANYLQMLKGIGIQEQSNLNRLAKEHQYYRRFSCQRLAHDLLGAIILEPDNIEQLYFCFYNIAQFIHAISGQYPLEWQVIESTWASKRELPWDGNDLGRICVTYLDQLEALI